MKATGIVRKTLNAAPILAHFLLDNSSQSLVKYKSTCSLTTRSLGVEPRPQRAFFATTAPSRPLNSILENRSQNFALALALSQTCKSSLTTVAVSQMSQI